MSSEIKETLVRFFPASLEIIQNWRQAYKFWTIWIAAIIAAFNALYAALPPEILMTMPDWLQTGFNIGAGICLALTRLIKQTEEIFGEDDV